MFIKSAQKYIPSSTLDQLSGVYTQRLLDYLAGSLYTEPEYDFFATAQASYGLLFSGKVGSGKRTVVDALAGSALMCGYDLWEVPISVLMGETPISTISLIEDFFNKLELEFKKEEGRIFILFDDIWLFNDDTRAGKLFFGRLKKLLKYKSIKLLAVAVFDEEPSNIPSFYRLGMKIVTIGNPQENFRRSIIAESMGAFLTNTLTAEYLAEITNGFSYGELFEFLDNVMMSLMGKSKIIDEEECTSYYVDDVEPFGLINKKRVEVMAEEIKKCRYKFREDTPTGSVYNYPTAAPIAVTSAVLSGESAQSAFAEKKNNEMNAYTPSGALDLSGSDRIDYGEIVNPEETENHSLPKF